MKRIGAPLRTFSLITLFLLYAVLQITQAIRPLVSKHTVSKTAKIEKVVCEGNSITPERKKAIPLMVVVIKELARNNACIYLPGLLQN